MRRYTVTEQDHKLIDLALAVLRENFDDGVYRHTVGCALRCKNGKVYQGVNCYAIHGSCAEYITMGSAISAGERAFDTIVAFMINKRGMLYRHVATAAKCYLNTVRILWYWYAMKSAS